jgi:hypothetical protein
MRRSLASLSLAAGLAAIALAQTTTAANAVNFTISDIDGVSNQNFGSLTAVDLGANPGPIPGSPSTPRPASTDTVEVTIDMSPSFLIDVGSHFLLTMSLLGTGRFDQSTFNALNPTLVGDLTAQSHGSSYNDGTFHGFTDAIAGDCGSGSSSGGCGSVVMFDIINFQGFGSIMNGGNSIFAAVDLSYKDTGNTGAVGLTGGVPVQLSAVPVPIVGAGLPGLITACGALIALSRRRRRKLA